MQFIDLHAQQRRIRDKIEKNISKVLDHGKYILGPEVTQLETQLADYVGVRQAIGVASGTDALLMPLMAYDVGPGDAVFTVPFTFFATAEVIKLTGATTVFVDIDSDTFNIDPAKLEEEIIRVKKEGKLNLKGIIPVDLFGQAADYDEINKIAKKYGLFVLEDAAQSFGGSYKNRKNCSLADVAATSFFPAKPLGCYGDGGMIFLNNNDLYEKLLSIRVHGQGTDKYDNIRIGINGRIDSMQCAVLLAKMEIFDEEIELRQEVANYYSKGLKDVVKVPYIHDYNISAWAQYSVLHPDREKIIKKLNEAGIPVAIYYPKPIHIQESFIDLGHKPNDFPVSMSVAEQIFSLPMYPYLGKGEQDKIIEVIKKA
ncbi:MAG: DegT/DnrJ/EryC1/StrS aminotransferase family protein [Bacteroidales bacterium]|nr:DegT/DnrJ/EryC1/StrS aminotransferase family protein [Bacteroidales bacterium]